MIVADASVVLTALVDDGPDGSLARAELAGENLVAPSVIDLEVASALRGLHRAGKVGSQRAELALADLVDLPLERVEHQPLLARCWDLRDHLTVYDAAYIALAEALDVPLLTADRRLAAATGPACEIWLLA